MRYPVARVVMPRDLSGVTNGKLSNNLLKPVNPNTKWQMHHIAARAWEALRAAAWANGIQLSVSGNPYRSFEQQASLFNQRYTSTFTNGINTRDDQRVWNGVRYYKRVGVAAVATPGTSNHGWGLAVDTAIDADGDLEFEWPPKSLNQQAINWLLANASRYGFSWEIQSEPWHIRYVTGDAIPQAVLAFESSVNINGQQPAFNPANGQWGKWPTQSKPTAKLGDKGDHVRYLQGVLKAKAGQNVTVDGNFGPQTEAAVKNLQKFVKLTADGLVGQQTWKTVDWLATV